MSQRSTPDLKTVTARKRLPISKKPLFVEIGTEGGKKIGLGYRRNVGAGTWVVRISDGKKGNTTQAIATANDDLAANGATILTFYQARDLALAFARSRTPDAPPADPNAGRPITLGQALDRYEVDLKKRGPARSCYAGSRPPPKGTDRAARSTARREGAKNVARRHCRVHKRNRKPHRHGTEGRPHPRCHP
jgi:hypothetical protein